MKRHSWLLPVFVAVLYVTAGWAEDMERLESLRLVDHPANDGDSFRVTDGVTEWNLRLYFVDTPETGLGTDSMARRVREQTRYFGLDRYDETIRFGELATEKVREWLADPFSAYTVHARAMGMSAVPRIYAFVVTADGRDLDKLLVREGLARAHGVGRRDYVGNSRDERGATLSDIEAAAMLERRGIWAASNPDRIAELRAAERQETRSLDEIRRLAGVGRLPSDEVMDLNRASFTDLQRLPGIGPALAQRIKDHRPFQSVEDLERVPGIGPNTLERLRPWLAIDTP